MTLAGTDLVRHLNRSTGELDGAGITRRYLSDLEGVFADDTAYRKALAEGNQLVYSVSSVEPEASAGGLHYGLGRIEAGRVGDEYFMTKGHLHAWREAAELYLGLSGEGVMLLEDESSGTSSVVPLTADTVVYVPGHTAHRTVNTGTAPLVYLGVYPAQAGHDYGAIAERNFQLLVMARLGEAQVIDRRTFGTAPEKLPGSSGGER